VVVRKTPHLYKKQTYKNLLALSKMKNWDKSEKSRLPTANYQLSTKKNSYLCANE
jgi:hypothetical protein